MEKSLTMHRMQTAKPQEPPENKTPVATKITGKMILEAIRQMDAEERRELTQVLFA